MESIRVCVKLPAVRWWWYKSCKRRSGVSKSQNYFNDIWSAKEHSLGINCSSPSKHWLHESCMFNKHSNWNTYYLQLVVSFKVWWGFILANECEWKIGDVEKKCKKLKGLGTIVLCSSQNTYPLLWPCLSDLWMKDTLRELVVTLSYIDYSLNRFFSVIIFLK